MTDYVDLVRPALLAVQPYQAGKPIEQVQREFGIRRVVKLASNEGPWGPVPGAIAAITRAATVLNRYPDPQGEHLASALASRHGVDVDCIFLGSGADGVLDCLAQALLDPEDEVVCPWPSFPSYVGYAAKQGAVVRRIPLHAHRLDLQRMLEAISSKTKIVYLCYPNNPTGTINSGDELRRYFDQTPDHVLTVVDQAYFEYVDDPDYRDAIEDYFKKGKRVLVLRTFSKIYGLAALRVGYSVADTTVVSALRKTRRAFDIAQPALDAACASLEDEAEIATRRARTTEARSLLVTSLRSHGIEPVGPAAANFVYAEIDGDSERLFDRLLREGVIVRPLKAFGSPSGIRITVGTEEEIAALDVAFERVLGR